MVKLVSYGCSYKNVNKKITLEKMSNGLYSSLWEETMTVSGIKKQRINSNIRHGIQERRRKKAHVEEVVIFILPQDSDVAELWSHLKF